MNVFFQFVQQFHHIRHRMHFPWQKKEMGSDSEPSSETSFVFLGNAQKSVLFDKLREAASKYERHVHYPDVHYLTVLTGERENIIEVTDPGMARTGGREMAIKKADLAILYYSACNLDTLTRLQNLKADLERKSSLPIRLICDTDDIGDYEEDGGSTGISSQSEVSGYESDPEQETRLRRRRSMERIRKQSDDGTIAIDMGKELAAELGDRCVFLQIASTTFDDADGLLRDMLMASKAKNRRRSRSLIPSLGRRSKSRDGNNKIAPQKGKMHRSSTEKTSKSSDDGSPKRKTSDAKNSKVCSIQ